MILYLNGYRMDTDNAVLALTYNFNNTLSGDENSISHSNQIAIPRTKRNTSFFEYYKNVTKAPTMYQCHVVNPRTGVTIFFGFAFLVKPVQKEYGLEIYQNPIDFFDTIDPLGLNDLNFTSSIVWDQATGDGARNASSGLVAPLINYGQFASADVEPQVFKTQVGSPFHILNYPPSVYFKTVMDKIFTDQGYSLSAFADTSYPKLIIPYGREEWVGSGFTLADILPDMSQKDFLKQFQAMFGAKFVLNDNSTTFRIKTINDVMTNGSYYNWSSKFMGVNDNQPDSNLYQHNVFKWSNTNFRSADVTINNPYLPLSNDAFVSPFETNGSETYLVDSSTDLIYGWKYLLWDTPASADLTNFTTTPKPELAMIRNPIAGVEAPSVFFGNLSRSDYQVAYKYADYDGNQPPLPWLRGASTLLLSYGVNFGFLQERYYKLNDIDVMLMQAEERLIFDKGEIYLVDSIVDYDPKQVTKVRALRVL